MNTLTHPVAPEEIMALLDGELSSAEVKTVETHVAECAECSALRNELQGTSEGLRVWTVPRVSTEMGREVTNRVDSVAAKGESAKPRKSTPLSFRNWRLWAIGGGGAILASAGLMFFLVFIPYYGEHSARSRQEPVQMYAYLTAPESAPAQSIRSAGVAGMEGYVAANPAQASVATTDARSRSKSYNVPLKSSALRTARIIGGVVGGTVPTPPPPVGAAAPMIARTVSMTILVKNIAESRTALGGILAQHHGYAAQLTINTPESGARSFQSSLRIPAGDLTAALDALRTLGRVQTETQSGEEVTQQHTDLVARLTNARETEARLRAILQQRTGKIEDVLDVEEKISETRGEIEQMEAEQKELEHRVDFAGVDLTLTEEYKAQLGGASTSVGNDISNSLVAGLRHAGGSLLGLLLFAEEYGPVILIWLVIMGVPAVLVWRRFARNRDPGY
jgi:anti-sigma factor RsiW